MNATVLSRVAERVYWLGRYLERTDATARLITVNGNLLMDLPVRLPLGWRPLIEITGSSELFDSLHGLDTQATERNVCRFLTTDTRNPGSIVNSITGLRDNVRHVRETMPRITFEYANDIYLYARSALAASQSRSLRGEALEGISRRVNQLEGFLSQNMLHDAHWDLLRLGNHLERADMTTRIIDARSADLFAGDYDLEPFQDIQWRSILRSLFAMQSYHASVRQPVDPALVLDFLFNDDRLPRSYLRCLNAARRALLTLPRNERPLRVCNRAIRALKTFDVKSAATADNGASLHSLIDKCQIHLGALHNEIVKTYFDYRPRRARQARPAKTMRQGDPA